MILLSAQDRRFLLLAGAVLAGVGATAARSHGWLGGLRTAPAIVVASAPVALIADTLRPRETLGQLFARRGVTDVDWGAVATAVRTFDPTRVRHGMVFTFAQRLGEDAPHAVRTRLGFDQALELARGPDGGWNAALERIPYRLETFVVNGTVTTSVSDAITEASADEYLPRDARIALVWSLADVYDWVVDFSRDVQEGDHFRVLAERMVTADGDVRLSRVLAARLDVGTRPLFAFRFDLPDGRQEFYDETGRSMRRDLLRAPLEYRRIGSGFSRSRFHPILRYRRPHNGIDFSAAYGAPVRSVGDGTIMQAGRSGGYGNLVEIRHAGSRVTRYAHLSSFGQGVHAGARVTQGQTVGYVGSTGLSTSPHLHYELLLNGRFVDPRRQFQTGQGKPIAEARRAAYEGERQRLLDLLEPRPAAALHAARVD